LRWAICNLLVAVAVLVASVVVVAVAEVVVSAVLSASLHDDIVIAAASTIRIFFIFNLF
jgi:hypothetical protein